MKKDFLDSVNVESPCSESWDEMTGNERVRFCSHCAKDVHDLSAMTRRQAERLVKKSNGKLCVRYVKTPPGKLITAPPTLTQIKRRSRVAAGVLAASVAFSTIAYAQQTDPVKPPKNWTQSVEKLSQTGETNKDFSTMSGTVADPNGAAIAGAKVTLRGVNNQTSRSTLTDEGGIYEFARVEPDVYEVEIESAGFKKLVVTNILVGENEKLEQAAVLQIAEMTIGTIVTSDEPLAPTEPQINQTVEPQELSELPRGKTFTMGLIAYAPPEEKPKAEKSKKTKKKKN